MTGFVPLPGVTARRAFPGARYRVHWATCPQADEHRKVER